VLYNNCFAVIALHTHYSLGAGTRKRRRTSPATCCRRSSSSTWCVSTPFTLHPTPCTLYSSPYTLRRSPHTVYPPPYTPHPTSYTLHPTPFTLHPSPSTLRPTPFTVHPTSSTIHPAVDARAILRGALPAFYLREILLRLRVRTEINTAEMSIVASYVHSKRRKSHRFVRPGDQDFRYVLRDALPALYLRAILSPPALKATQGQMGGFLSQLPYKCHLEEVVSVEDCLEICPQLDSWVASQRVEDDVACEPRPPGQRTLLPPWSRVEGKSQVNVPKMRRGGICMGVDSRNHSFAPGASPGRRSTCLIT